MTIVPRSTSEAEYIALSEVVREVASIRNFIIEISLGYELGLITIRYDSTTAKRLAKNSEFSTRTRYIRYYYYYTR